MPPAAEIFTPSKKLRDDRAIIRALQFARAHVASIAACSALLVIPCFWHHRIEAGDLPSHTYNAWLAQLIQQGRAPGLSTVHQLTNTLFDFLLLYCAKVFGFAAGPKIAVATCVLMFFWGMFSFLSVFTERAPWLLTPVIAMLAYGYTFNMGFFNYYLSLGLACCALALLWSPLKTIPKPDWIVGTLFLALALLAHPIGPLWCLGALAYLSIRKMLPGPWRFAPAMASIGIVFAAHWYMAHAAPIEINWPDRPFYLYNGFDQLVIYSARYRYIAAAMLVLFVLWIAASVYRPRDRASLLKSFLAAELYLVSFCVVAMLPEDLRLGDHAAWAGLLVSRLTLISAIFSLSALNLLKPAKWVLVSATALATIFFTLLYRDTQSINQLELHVEQLLASFPNGTRVIPTLEPRPDSRISFVGHVVDRACIGHCFTYSNYEPSSQQFRVRASTPNAFATTSPSDSQEMESGNYTVQSADPPLVNIYQCNPTDFTIVCSRNLTAGDKTGPPETIPDN